MHVAKTTGVSACLWPMLPRVVYDGSLPVPSARSKLPCVSWVVPQAQVLNCCSVFTNLGNRSEAA